MVDQAVCDAGDQLSPAVESPADPPLWRNRDFLLLWTSQAVSALGTSMAGIVYPLLTLRATGSVAQAGVVGFVGMGAATILRLPSGVLADRWPRKAVMVVSDLIRAVVTVSIVIAILMYQVTVYHLIVAAIVSAACGVMSDSAQAVAVRHVVPSRQLPQAMAQNEGRGHAAAFAGQPLGGFLYGIGMSVPVIADAISFLLSGALVGLIRKPLHDRRAVRDHPSIWRDLPTGLRYVWRDAFLRITLLCAAGFQFVFSGLMLIIIASATERGTAAAEIGVAFAIGSVGGILGAAVAGRMQAWFPPSALVVSFGVVATVSLAALSVIPNPYAIGAVLGIIFFTATPANAMLAATQIQITPPELQGRVLSAVVLVAAMAAPLGPLTGGLLFDRWGQVVTYVVFAVITAALTIRMWLSGAIRAMRRPE
jgi:MFS family permease